jgi:hypothetical protein
MPDGTGYYKWVSNRYCCNDVWTRQLLKNALVCVFLKQSGIIEHKDRGLFIDVPT